MRYDIVLAPEAVEDLRSLKANVRAEVRDAMETHLRHQPTKTSKSRTKRLRGLSRPQYRLRVGDDIRVFYDVTKETVEVLAVVSKSDADEWLHAVNAIAIEFHGGSRAECGFDELMHEQGFAVVEHGRHTVIAVRRPQQLY